MKISIFTPTNNAAFLLPLYQSLKPQDFYEWLLLVNGDITADTIPGEIRDDHRVRIVRYEGDNKVGALKQVACGACTGDILIEVDHDDMLLPGAVEKVRQAFQDPEVVFAYSSFAEFNHGDGSPREYSEVFGWQYKDFEYEGKRYRTPINPPHDPYHASIIYFAPNHLRAWRRDAYCAVGGHNPDMNVLDDLDLMCRLYNYGKFARIDECLYLYRVHGDNTWLQRNLEIQANILNQRRHYLHGMVEMWAKREGHRMINLGGRFNNPAGYESVDLKDADIIADLSKPWPFEDSSVGVVRAFDFMEHLPDKMHVLSEIHRVLKPGGYLLSMTPSTTGPNGEAGMGADQDPTHVSRWNRNSFWYVTRREQAQYIDNTQIRFQPAILENCFPSQWHRENLIPYVRADLVCLKEGYSPHGLIEI